MILFLASSNFPPDKKVSVEKVIEIVTGAQREFARTFEKTDLIDIPGMN